MGECVSLSRRYLLYTHAGSYLAGLETKVNWDAFDDDLRSACQRGRLLLLRDILPEIPHPVQVLVDIIGSRRKELFHVFESRPGARFALVLDGWPNLMIGVRSNGEQYTV